MGCQLKYFKIFRTLAVAVSLVLIVSIFSVIPAMAAEELGLTPDHGEIGDMIEAYGSGFNAGTQYDLYFSDELASLGEEIGIDVLNYEFLRVVFTDTYGTFEYAYFDVPDQLTDGAELEDVYDGTYYAYAAISCFICSLSILVMDILTKWT